MSFVPNEKKWKYLSFALIGILATGVITQPQAFAISDTELKKKFDQIWEAINALITKTDNLEQGQQSATEEVEELTARVDALGTRVEEESEDTKEALQELTDRLEEAEVGLESKADDEEVQDAFAALEFEVADLSAQIQALEKRVVELEGAGDGTCTDGLDNNSNQLIDSEDPSCGKDSTPGSED